MNTRLAAMLFIINRGTSLFHDLNLGFLRENEKLLRLLHLGLQKVHDLLLCVLVLGDILGIDEVEVHTKLADRSRLFREMKRSLIVFDVLHVELLELIHAILRNEERSAWSAESGVRKHATLLNATIFEELGEAHSVLPPDD